MSRPIAKKLTAAVVAMFAAASFGLTGCAGENTQPQTTASQNQPTASEGSAAKVVTIEDNLGTKQVPVNPERVVALDNRSFEILDKWNIKPVAAARSLVPKTIPNIANNEDIVNVGNHREPNLEAIVAANPQVIISGQRFSKYNKDIEKLVPNAVLIDLEPRDGQPLDKELLRQIDALGKIFGKQDQAQQLAEDFQKSIERARSAYNKDQTVLAVNVSGGQIGYVAPKVGRTWGPVFDILGLTPALKIAEGTDNHQGDDISVEAIAQANPDWLLVLDRDAGVSSADSKPAQKVLAESQALQNVTAIKNDNVYVAPADTYTNESIITYTEIFNEFAAKLESKK